MISEGNLMDANIYELWGQMFLNTAKGRRQMEEYSRWLRQGLSGSDSLTAFFRQIYGLDKVDKVEKDGPEYLRFCEKAMQSFQQSFREYLRLFDAAPREEIEALMKECEALKQKVSEQEQTIEHLKTVLGDKGMESAETVRDLQHLLKKQADQFQEMMKAMGQAFQQRRPSKSK
jgi:uncharacterized coiled-coil protein SlyX